MESISYRMIGIILMALGVLVSIICFKTAAYYNDYLLRKGINGIILTKMRNMHLLGILAVFLLFLPGFVMFLFNWK